MRRFKVFKVIFYFLLLAVLSPALNTYSASTDVSSLNVPVTEFRLENGMLFLVIERQNMPQIACRVAIRAGSALEENGKSGIAHLLEHMMFKGTKNFGTLDPEKDQELQEKIETAYQIVLSEKKKRNPDLVLIKSKLAEMEKLRREVQKIYVPQAFSAQLERNGAVGVNAFTSKDQTQYFLSLPSDMIEQWFSIVSEQLFEPSWREFYVEKDVVQREWAFRYVNDPGGAAWLDLNTTAYTSHPYRNPTIGWKADMENFNTRDASDFHAKYYNPTNAVCVLVGNLKVDDAKRLAKIYFGRYPRGELAPEEVTREPPQKGPRKSVRLLEGARTPVVRIGFHSARMGTDDFYALDVMTMVLSHGRSARIKQNILNNGKAVQAWAYNPDNRYGGMIILGGSPNEPEELKQENLQKIDKKRAYLRECEAFEKLMLDEVEKLKTELVSNEELERIKKQNRRDFLDKMRSNEQLASILATLEIQTGWRYFNTYLEKMSEVTPDDIVRVAKRYIREENRTSTYVIPGGKPTRPPESYTEIRSSKGSEPVKKGRPKDFRNISVFETPQGWRHPLSFERKPEKIRYPKAESAIVHGAKVFYLKDKELPLVDLTLSYKAGSVDTTDENTGLTRLLNGSIIRGGSEKYAPAELAMALDRDAIHLSVSVGGESSSIGLSVMKEDWDKGLSLLEEVLLRPKFDQGVLNVVKKQVITSLKRQGGDARSVVGREARIWRFKGHPYGRDPLLGLKTIPSISKEDIMSFLKAYFVPSNMVVSVSGDIEKKDVIDGLSRLFEKFPGEKAPVRKIGEPSETPPILALINKPGQVQSQIILGLRGVRRTHPDYWKMNLLVDILGGSDSLMFKRLRDDLGLVYAAGFYQTYKWEVGTLIGYIGCKGDMTAQAVEETVNIMEALRNTILPSALEQKRMDALNSFVFNVDTPAQLVKAYARYYLRNEPLDTLERIQDVFFETRLEDLKELASTYLLPDKLQIFVVGDKTIPIKLGNEKEVNLEEQLSSLAGKIGIPFTKIKLR